jgi:hypothetical protein
MPLINARHIDTHRAGDAKGGGNYPSLMDYLNQRHVVGTPFNGEIVVVGSNVALLSTTIFPGALLAIGNTSTSTDGAILAAVSASPVGTADTSTVSDDLGNIANLVEIRDADSHDPIVDEPTERKVFGLLQAGQGTVDGSPVGAVGSENTQITFITFGTNDAIIPVSITTTINIAVGRLFARRHLPEFIKQCAPLVDEVPQTSGGSAMAGLFVTDVTNAGSGIVGNKVYEAGTVPANKVILEALTDDDTVEIHFMAEGGAFYSPTVLVDGILCTNLAQYGNDQRLFYGSVAVSCSATRTITLDSSTGSTTSVLINRAASGPEIIQVRFAGTYPGTQTEVKNNDLFQISIDFEPTGTEPTEVVIQDFGACKQATLSLVGSGLNWGTVHTAVVTVTIDSTGNTVQALPCRLSAKNSFGTIGNTAATNDGGGTTNAVNLVNCNDIIPTFIDNAITYPMGQTAFKGNETGTKDTIVNNYSSVVYTSPNSDFIVANSSTYEQIKTITCNNPGTYNDSATNFRIVATRSANGTTATFNKVIEVADTAPLVSVTQPYARLRSSASGINYTITATANQNLAGAPSLNVPVSGTWQGGSFTGSAKVWTRAIQIIDGDAAGTAVWGWQTSAPTNRAGIPATIIGSESVGGFTSRVLVLAPFATQTQLDTIVANSSKLTFAWSFKTGMLFQPIGTPAPVVNGWTIDAIGTNPTQVIILDTSAANASSQASTISIEELV